MLMLVWVSLLPFFQPVSAAALKLISLNNYRTVLDSGQLELMLNTLMVAVATATIAVGADLRGAAGSRCGARPAAGSSTSWRPCRWCSPASSSASR